MGVSPSVGGPAGRRMGPPVSTPMRVPSSHAPANCRSAPAPGAPFFLPPVVSGAPPRGGRCDVLLSATTPQARFWTITLYDPEGRLVANSAQRHGFTSQEIIRNADGSFEIMVSPRARPGNWLPTGGVEKYLLVLRLYDTPIGVATRTGSEAPMPLITKRACL